MHVLIAMGGTITLVKVCLVRLKASEWMWEVGSMVDERAEPGTVWILLLECTRR